MINFTERSWKDFEYWLDTDKKTSKKIRELIKECARTPFEGTGKPEPLKGDLSGYWSRRIDQEHRLIYSHEDEELTVVLCRYHYSK